MSKYCKPMGLYVTYLDCMECEERECIQSHKKEDKKEEENNMNKTYLHVKPNDTIFCVFASVREGYDKNVVLMCKVQQAQVYVDYTEYIAVPVKVVVGAEGDKKQEAKKYIHIHFRGANIDTGYRNKNSYCYPVFTTKERCIKWLRG